MLKVQLPQLIFSLDDTAGRQDLQMFETLTNEFRKMGAGQPPEAQWFHQRRQEIMDAVINGKKLKHIIFSASDIRVLIFLWSTNSLFVSKCPISKKHIKLLLRIKPALTPSQIFGLIRIYFLQFDQITDLPFFCKYIRDQLAIIFPKKRLSQDMQVYCDQKEILFDPSLKNFLALFKKKNINLKEMCNHYHIPWDHTARFIIAAKHHLYVSPIEKMRLGDRHPIFDRVSCPEIKNMPYDSQFSLAQTISMHMMDKADHKNMPDNWRQIIISLLGDPRMPKSSAVYQKGWAGLPSDYENQMQKWLSQMDMLVFLELLKEIGNQSGNEMIQRMFPARKTFLESLYQTGMITRTRLFLSNDAVEYIEKQYEPEDRPMFAQINHKNKSIIYMQVGRVHLIEGTHNYSARLLDRLPESSGITDQQKKKFILTELATALDHKYVSEFKDSKHLYVIPHDIHNAWQRKLTEVLQAFGVHLLDVSEPLSI
jgi:hypothetical protein